MKNDHLLAFPVFTSILRGNDFQHFKVLGFSSLYFYCYSFILYTVFP